MWSVEQHAKDMICGHRNVSTENVCTIGKSNPNQKSVVMTHVETIALMENRIVENMVWTVVDIVRLKIQIEMVLRTVKTDARAADATT